jgi:hypothetical protein
VACASVILSPWKNQALGVGAVGDTVGTAAATTSSFAEALSSPGVGSMVPGGGATDTVFT